MPAHPSDDHRPHGTAPHGTAPHGTAPHGTAADATQHAHEHALRVAAEADFEQWDCGAMLARLYHYLDGELTVERRTVIAAHLDGCPSCFSAYDFEAELRIVVSDRVRTRVPADLADRIRRALGGC